MNKLFKSVLALGTIALTTSFAEIKITDNFSVEGFVDLSANWSLDTNDVASSSSMGMALDQVELDVMYKFSDMVSARADFNDLGAGTVVEQGFVTLTPTKGLNINLGKFLSCSGFETAEPTGLFQYSVSKNLDANPVYGGYQNGAAFSFSQAMFSLYGALVTNVWNGGDTDLEYPGFEGQIGLTPVKGLTFKAAYLGQTYAENPLRTLQSLINVWTMYSMGMITVAGEFNMPLDFVIEDDDGAMTPIASNGIGWIGLVNLAAGKGGFTLRFSGMTWDELDDPDMEITGAPSLVVSDHLSMIAEYKFEINTGTQSAGLEALFVF